MPRRCVMGCPDKRMIHRFPEEPEMVRNEWHRRLGVPKGDSRRLLYACSRHFSQKDYKLRWDTVPDLELHETYLSEMSSDNCLIEEGSTKTDKGVEDVVSKVLEQDPLEKSFSRNEEPKEQEITKRSITSRRFKLAINPLVIDVKKRKLLEDKNKLQEEVKHLKLELKLLQAKVKDCRKIINNPVSDSEDQK